MNRKKWTPKENVTESVLKIREKRKWQIALRRYILEGSPCYEYAPYFSIDSKGFRYWIEIQFEAGMTWDTFGKSWQFDHIVPLQFFDFSNETDLRLCWCFLNIRPQPIEGISTSNLNVLSAKAYFNTLFETTGINMAEMMVQKLHFLEDFGRENATIVQEFLNSCAENLNQYNDLSSAEFLQLNSGSNLQDILLQKQILNKFG